MGTNCAPLVADLFLYCNERDFMDSLNHDNQADVIEAFNSTSRYLDDLLNIDNLYFEGMVNQIHTPELQLNKLLYIIDSIILILLKAITYNLYIYNQRGVTQLINICFYNLLSRTL